MKNTLIIIVVIGLLVFGFIFIKEKQKTNLAQNTVWPETVPANQTKPNNYSTSSTGDNTNNPPVVSSSPTQTQIENFVYQNSSDCSSGDCSSVSVTFSQDVGNQYLITAIFTELDDSVSVTKKQWLVLYNNGSINLAPVQPNPASSTMVNNQNSQTRTNQNTTTIMVPLINNDAVGQYGPFGCGAYLSFIPRQVPETSAVLNATYNWLFSHPVSFDDGNYSNVVASQTNLNFNDVEIIGGVAKVYLTGNIMSAHCGDATFAAQIEQAALQYPTVNDIQVYLNGQLFDWCLISEADPEESGCDVNPKPWDTQKIFEI